MLASKYSTKEKAIYFKRNLQYYKQINNYKVVVLFYKIRLVDLTDKTTSSG